MSTSQKILFYFIYFLFIHFWPSPVGSLFPGPEIEQVPRAVEEQKALTTVAQGSLKKSSPAISQGACHHSTQVDHG